MRRGGGFLAAESETCLGVGLGARGGGLRVRGVFCRGMYGRGPSSTTQSLRSMSEVLRPRFGGEGEGDGGMDMTGVEGRIGVMDVAEGDIGVSRRSGGDRGTTIVALEACMASNACIRAFTAEAAIVA